MKPSLNYTLSLFLFLLISCSDQKISGGSVETSTLTNARILKDIKDIETQSSYMPPAAFLSISGPTYLAKTSVKLPVFSEAQCETLSDDRLTCSETRNGFLVKDTMTFYSKSKEQTFNVQTYNQSLDQGDTLIRLLSESHSKDDITLYLDYELTTWIKDGTYYHQGFGNARITKNNQPIEMKIDSIKVSAFGSRSSFIFEEKMTWLSWFDHQYTTKIISSLYEPRIQSTDWIYQDELNTYGKFYHLDEHIGYWVSPMEQDPLILDLNGRIPND
jgi:hypothetical protein